MPRRWHRWRQLLKGYLNIALFALTAPVVALIALTGGVLLATAAAWTWNWRRDCFQRGKRLIATARAEIAFDEKADFVLYLRGFVDDIVASSTVAEDDPFMLPLTEEEHLVRALGAFYPAVAIGRPGEDTYILGAKRVYIDSMAWQERVRSLLHRARLVVLRLGFHEGLTWELRVALKELPLEKIVILVPDSSTFGRLVTRHSDLAWDMLEQELGRTLPTLPEKLLAEWGSLRGLIFFKPNGDPIVYPLPEKVDRSLCPLADTLRDCFAFVLATSGAHTSFRPVMGQRAVAFFLDLFFIILLTANEPSWWALTLSAWIGFEVAFKASPCKLLGGLKVRSVRNGWLPARIVTRNLVKLLPTVLIIIALPEAGNLTLFLLTLFLSALIIPFRRWRAPLHDILAGTTVIGRSSRRIERELESRVRVTLTKPTNE